MIKIFQIFIIAVGVFCSSLLVAQVNTYKFEEIDSLMKVEKRPVMVFIHTDWCKYCQAMKNKSFKDSLVVQNLNEKYYFVEFNGETKEDVVFHGDTYSFKPSGYNTGVHELALALGEVEGEVSYPATCILNSSYEIVFIQNSFLDEKYLQELLKKNFKD